MKFLYMPLGINRHVDWSVLNHQHAAVLARSETHLLFIMMSLFCLCFDTRLLIFSQKIQRRARDWKRGNNKFTARGAWETHITCKKYINISLILSIVSGLIKYKPFTYLYYFVPQTNYIAPRIILIKFSHLLRSTLPNTIYIYFYFFNSTRCSWKFSNESKSKIFIMNSLVCYRSNSCSGNFQSHSFDERIMFECDMM